MTSLCAAVARLELLACTVTPSTVPVLPTNVSRAVVSGMIAMLSWSWKPLRSLRLEHADHVERLRRR